MEKGAPESPTLGGSFVVGSASGGPSRLLRSLEQAEQLLLLTYVADLAFFERQVLGEAREIGAATTVIADAAMTYGSPLAVRMAGRRYLDCRALCPGGGAFHPKLIVAAGRQEATVAIGSGNLSVPGWHGNEELWTVLHVDQDGGPRAIGQVGGFLRELAASAVDLPVEGEGALLRVARLLEGHSTELPGPRLVSSLGTQIVAQLPAGPVEELTAYAPFHDRRLDGLEAVIERMRPRRLTVYVQPQTRVDGGRLAALVERHGGRVAWCADSPYRHGKLIEWVSSSGREALTGSPNLSSWALTGTVGAAGNLELGLVGPIEAPLAPVEVPPPSDGLSRLEPVEPKERDAGEPASVALLLSATQLPTGLVSIRLSHGLAEQAVLQAFDPVQDVWLSVPGIDIPAETGEFQVPPVGLAAGRAVRVRVGAWLSNVVYVCDPERAARRPFKRIGRATGTPVEVFEDGRLNDLLEDAIALKAQLLELRESAPSTAGERAGGPGGATSQELSDYLAVCASVADEATVDWALARPALPALGGGYDSPGSLSDETGDEAAESEAESKAPSWDLQAAIRRAGDGRRRALRRFCNDVVKHGRDWPHLLRAMGARYVINAVGAELWPDCSERNRLLIGLIEVLAEDDGEWTAEDRAAEASYAVICIAMLAAEVTRRWVNDEDTIAFETATRAGAGLLPDADQARVEAIVADLREAHGGEIESGEIWELVEELRHPLFGAELAAERLGDAGALAHALSPDAIELLEPLPAGIVEWSLFRALGFAASDGPIEVRAGTAKLACRAVWRKPWLAIERRGSRGSFGNVYRLSERISLQALVNSQRPSEPAAEWLPDPTETWMVGQPVPPRAASLLSTQASPVLGRCNSVVGEAP
jgi:hypothetical protein